MRKQWDDIFEKSNIVNESCLSVCPRLTNAICYLVSLSNSGGWNDTVRAMRDRESWFGWPHDSYLWFVSLSIRILMNLVMQTIQIHMIHIAKPDGFVLKKKKKLTTIYHCYAPSYFQLISYTTFLESLYSGTSSQPSECPWMSFQSRQSWHNCRFTHRSWTAISSLNSWLQTTTTTNQCQSLPHYKCNKIIKIVHVFLLSVFTVFVRT